MAYLVSILIPAYNAERWIKDTIQSALAQTWENIEVFVVDDGSTDNTAQIARKFESKSLKVISQKNGGPCYARNVAFTMCQGDFIQWLDSDDLLAPDKLSAQLSKHNNHGGDRILYSSAWGRFFYRTSKAKFEPDILWQDMGTRDFLVRSFTSDCWMQPSSWLVSRDLTERAGPWNENLFLNDDGEYFCRVIAESSFVRFVENARCYYRYGFPGCLSSQKSPKAIASLDLSIKLCVDRLLQLEHSEETIKASIRLMNKYLSSIYPYATDPHVKKLMDKACSRIIEFGGKIERPEETLKFKVARKVLGRRNARYLGYLVQSLKFFADRNWDWLLANLTLYNRDH